MNAHDENRATTLLDEDDLKTSRAVALLLDKGAGASISDKNSTTPLYLAASYGLGADIRLATLKTP